MLNAYSKVNFSGFYLNLCVIRWINCFEFWIDVEEEGGTIKEKDHGREKEEDEELKQEKGEFLYFQDGIEPLNFLD